MPSFSVCEAENLFSDQSKNKNELFFFLSFFSQPDFKNPTKDHHNWLTKSQSCSIRKWFPVKSYITKRTEQRGSLGEWIWELFSSCEEIAANWKMRCYEEKKNPRNVVDFVTCGELLTSNLSVSEHQWIKNLVIKLKKNISPWASFLFFT